MRSSGSWAWKGRSEPIHDLVAAGQHLFAPVGANGGLVSGAMILSDANEANLIAGLLYANFHTAANPNGEIRGQLVLAANSPPTVTCPQASDVECTSHRDTPVVLVAAVADPDGDPLMVVWTIDGKEQPEILVPSGGATTDAQVPFSVKLGLGEHTVSVAVTDGESVAVSCESVITVVDTTAPVINSIKPYPASLWPPNHKMKTVRVAVDADDACGKVTTRVVQVTSNEPVNGEGDGNTSPDWLISDDGKLQLRAERSGVNRAKSRAAPLKSCEFLGYKLNKRAKLAWTEKARHRFKERVREPERSGDRLPGGQPREG